MTVQHASSSARSVADLASDTTTRERVAFVASLSEHGSRPALLVAGPRSDAIDYAELSARVERRRAELATSTGAHLVAITGGNDVETVVTYLAALAGGHVAWLVQPGARSSDLDALYRPDVVVTVSSTGVDIERRGERPQHEIHPDLTLLMSTSGSTGAAKVARLSATNVQANATAIATALEITADDRAITSLPLHYCYGLSVVNSHLAVGASIVLSDASVVDPCFWNAVAEHRVTNVAGVPATYELLDRIGFEDMDVPSLRLLTQAGGRLAPQSVRRYALLGRRKGFRFVVMYGQTEATARMAYLPPELAADHPTSVGVAIPGGSIRIDDGEIVYRGPNVMMGYATSAADLAAGPELAELRTGDLGRIDEHGLLEITGRRSRFVKICGLRIDLDEVERILADAFFTAACTGTDDALVVAVVGAGLREAVHAVISRDTGLPRSVVHVHEVDDLPRLASGKIDHTAIAALEAPAAAQPAADTTADVRQIFREVFERTVKDSDTFVSLGGDSFTYVEMSIRLESAVGALPRSWHVTPIGRLAMLRPRRGRAQWVETNVVLRAAAITLVVGTHMGVFVLRGGAHVLLAIAGFNFARFHLARRSTRERMHAVAASVAKIAVPTSLWIGVQMMLSGGYSLASLLLVNNYVGSSWRRDGRWNYWYIEALVQILVVAALVVAVPLVRRLERANPYWFAVALLSLTLLPRVGAIELGDPYNSLFRSHTIAWFFVLGWAAAAARTPIERLLLTAVTALAVPGFFQTEASREVIVLAGLLALIWVARVPLPRPAARLVAAVAAASLAIFLTHWQVWPALTRVWIPEVAWPVTIAVGVLAWAGLQRATSLMRSSRRLPALV